MNRTNSHSIALCMQFLLFSCLLFLISSCQSVGSDLNKDGTLTSLSTPQPSCAQVGSVMDFPIFVEPTQGASDMDIDGATLIDPYLTEECMCKIQSYSITISDITEADVLAVFGKSELDPSQYSITTNGDGDVVITITDLAEDSDADLSFQIDLLAGISYGTIEGGGLCIVENVSGSGGGNLIPVGQYHTRPIKVLENSRWEAYIPVQ